MAKLAKALAPLCAVILGVLMYVRWMTPWIAVAMIVVGVLVWIVARNLITRKTKVSAIVISLWICFGIAIMAFITHLLLWVTLHIPALFPNLPAETVKEVCSVITGALTTFTGVLVTKDMEEGGGFFWPGGQFRRQLNKVFSKNPFKISGEDPAYELAFADRTHQNGLKGWGIDARLKRATGIQAWLDSRTPPPTNS